MDWLIDWLIYCIGNSTWFRKYFTVRVLFCCRFRWIWASRQRDSWQSPSHRTRNTLPWWPRKALSPSNSRTPTPTPFAFSTPNHRTFNRSSWPGAEIRPLWATGKRPAAISCSWSAQKRTGSIIASNLLCISVNILHFDFLYLKSCASRMNCLPVKNSTRKNLNELLNQSINQSNNQSINQPIKRSIVESIINQLCR